MSRSTGRSRRLRLVVAAATIVSIAALVGGAGTPRLAVGDPSTWRLVWADEFTGLRGAKPDPSIWTIQTGAGGWGNRELQTYTRSAVQLNGSGALTITATIGSASAGPTYSSGRITSEKRGTFDYGRLEARIRLPEGKGLLPAFWLMGDDLSTAGWPGAGEIDVVETPSITRTSEHHVHAPSTGSSGKASVGAQLRHPTPLSAGYHVYSLEKTPGRLVIRVDGRTALIATRASLPAGGRWVFDKHVHVLFSLAIGGDWPGSPDATTPRVSVMSIDWIRLYQ